MDVSSSLETETDSCRAEQIANRYSSGREIESRLGKNKQQRFEAFGLWLTSIVTSRLAPNRICYGRVIAFLGRHSTEGIGGSNQSIDLAICQNVDRGLSRWLAFKRMDYRSMMSAIAIPGHR
jgi:hypothetical protein